MNVAAKAVILPATYYNVLGAIRGLARAGITVVGMHHSADDNYAFASRYLSESHVIPNMKTEPEAALQALVDYGVRQDVKPVLILAQDTSVIFADRYQDILRRHYHLSLPEQQGIAQTIVEKDTLYPLAEKHGVRVPTTVLLDDPQLLEKARTRLGYPLIVKPAESIPFVAKFRKKVIICRDEAELRDAKNLLDANAFVGFAQEMVPGDDEHMLLYDAYVQQDGTIEHIFTGQKLRQWPINFGASCLMRQKYQADLVEVGTQFFRDIGWRGFAEIEFKRHAETGELYLIEINARITNFDAVICASGFSPALLTYQDLTGQALTPRSRIITEDTGLAFEFLHESRAAQRAYIAAGDWKASHVKAQRRGLSVVHAIWDASDPKPYFVYSLGLIRNRLQRLLKR